MFSPQMMAQAQQMMANMSPEQMEEMTKMAANMDPSMMQQAARMSGQDPEQLKQATEEMKNMRPDELKSKMGQAQQQMDHQVHYYLAGAEGQKKIGNTRVSTSDFAGAVSAYDAAIAAVSSDSIPEQVRAMVTAHKDSQTLIKACHGNSAHCHLQAGNWHRALASADACLALEATHMKALFRRGQALRKLGRLDDALVSLQMGCNRGGDGIVREALEECKDEVAAKMAKESPAEAKMEEKPEDSQKEPAAAPAAASSSVSSASYPKVVELDDEEGAPAVQPAAAASEPTPSSSSSSAPAPAVGVDSAAAGARKADARVKVEADLAAKVAAAESEAAAKNKPLMPFPSGMPTSMPAGGMPTCGMSMPPPETMKQMMSSMSAEQLASMSGCSVEEAKQQKQALESMSPEMLKMATAAMSSMTPEQQAAMMKMRENKDSEGMKDIMNNPEFIKAAEAMAKNLTPQQMQDMAKSQGMEMSDAQAQWMLRLMPMVTFLMKAFLRMKRLFAMLGPYRLVIVAVVVALLAVYMVFLSGGGEEEEEYY